MSVPTIYAFKMNKEGTKFDLIVCCGYRKDEPEDRERAIKEVQDSASVI